MTLEWRQKEHDGVSNHQPNDCLLNRLFRRRSKKYQSPMSLAFVRGIHQSPVQSFERNYKIYKKYEMAFILPHVQYLDSVYIVTPHDLVTLQWRNNERDGVSNHQPHHCLLSRLFRRWPKKTSKLRVTGLCEGNSPVTGEFPAQMASNAEEKSILWRHHELGIKWINIACKFSFFAILP